MLVAAAVVAAVGAGWVMAAQETPDAPYDTTKIGFPKGHRSWAMVRTFIVAERKSPAYGIRNAFLNPQALEALQKGGTAYPDGAEIAMAIHEIAEAPGGRQTQGPLRGTFLMVRDAKQYAATDGWGYARFDAKGEPVKVNPLKNCHECHLSVEKTGWVFTKPAD